MSAPLGVFYLQGCIGIISYKRSSALSDIEGRVSDRWQVRRSHSSSYAASSLVDVDMSETLFLHRWFMVQFEHCNGKQAQVIICLSPD